MPYAYLYMLGRDTAPYISSFCPNDLNNFRYCRFRVYIALNGLDALNRYDSLKIYTKDLTSR